MRYRASLRRVARNLPCRGVFWRLEATSNDLDLDFNRSSIELSRFLSPNIGDLQQKKGIHQNWDAFSVQIYVISTKKSSAKLKPSFFVWNHIWSLTNYHRQYHWVGGGLFSFLVQKSASKLPKTGCFAYSSGQWGAIAPPPPPPASPLATLLASLQKERLRKSSAFCNGLVKNSALHVLLRLMIIVYNHT